MTRREDIQYNFIGNDRIWPPGVSSDLSHPFMKALLEVLERLPDDAYDVVADFVSFVVEVSYCVATNVPFERFYPATPHGFKVQFDTIVVFHEALGYSHNVLVGLLAHELAHSLVSKPEYKEDEESADDQALKWGFGKEFEALRSVLNKTDASNV